MFVQVVEMFGEWVEEAVEGCAKAEEVVEVDGVALANIADVLAESVDVTVEAVACEEVLGIAGIGVVEMVEAEVQQLVRPLEDYRLVD